MSAEQDSVASGDAGGQTRYVYDGFDRKQEHYQDTTGLPRVSAFYQYDSLDRIRQAFKFKRNDQGSDDVIAKIFYRYLGASDLVLSEDRNPEQQDRQVTTYRYGPDGRRLSQDTETTNGAPGAGEYWYSIDPRGNVEAITIPSGQTAATYGYTALGRDITALYTGLDKPDEQNPFKVPVNVYRFGAQQFDQASGTYDMGFRDYSPTASRFLTPDHYSDVQADLRLGPVPFDIAMPDNRALWQRVKDMGREFVNHIKEDPWQFAGEVAIGIAAATAVGLICTTGIGCVILAGIAAGAASAAYGYTLDVAQGEHAFDVGDFAKQTAIGAAVGGITAGIGYGIGRGLSRLVQKIRPPTCLHSFAPGTLVLMADGTEKRIEDVKVGDLVLTTDPETGLTVARRVTHLHLNQDWDLAEVTVYDTDTGDTTTLRTTWYHPFWNATEDAWTNAADLTPGTRLRDAEGKETQQVVAVRTWTGLQQMHDLTVDDLHTYYVVAADRPVLVHNCGSDAELLGLAKELGKTAEQYQAKAGTAWDVDNKTSAVIRALFPDKKGGWYEATVVGASGEGMSLGQISLAQKLGHVAVEDNVAGLTHAEQNVLLFINKLGGRPIAGAASRSVCTETCGIMIRSTGGRISGEVYNLEHGWKVRTFYWPGSRKCIC
jgi:RHS repeat-associated protein